MRSSVAIRVGEKIRELRRARGLTLAQVGERTQMTKGQVGKIEHGAPRTSPDQYEAHDLLVGLQQRHAQCRAALLHS